MILEKKVGNLLNQKNIIAQCISFDCVMGAGIAKLICEKYPGMRKTLKAFIRVNELSWPTAILYESKEGSVINLITKERYFMKPTYETLEKALLVMKEVCIENSISTVAIPKLGCGLDKLTWEKVEKLLHSVFDNMDITFRVITLKDE